MGVPVGIVSTFAGLVALECVVGLFARLNWGGHGVARSTLLAVLLAWVVVLSRTDGGPNVRPPLRRLPKGPFVYMACFGALLTVVTATGLFEWGSGLVRLSFMGIAAAFMGGIWLAYVRRGDRGAIGVLIASLIVLLGLNATRELAWAVDAAQRTNNLRLDEGRTTWRAARLLWRGENPYGIGVIVDDTGFERRLARRQGLGIGPVMPASAVGPALERYLSSLDPDQRIALLPDVSGAPLAVRWEAAVVGYKYGPVPLLITAALERRLGSMSVPLSNGLACLLLFGVVALIVRSAGADWLVAGAVVAASLLDPIMVWFFVQLTATDVWPLLFGFTAVLAVMWRWPTVAGIAVTLAVASKIMPGALFLLLLPIMRSWRALATCVVTGLVLVLPWIAWDPMGFICNFALWGLSMDPDVNSWVSSAPAWLVPIVRSILAMAILALSCMLALHRLARMCAGFAAITILVLAGGSAFHNNYVPWVTIWMMLAIVEALHIPGAISMRLMGAQPSAMAEPGAPIVGR